MVYRLLLAGENQPGLNRAVIFGIIIAAFAAWPVKQLLTACPAYSDVAANVDAGVGVLMGMADIPDDTIPLWPVVVVVTYLIGASVVLMLTVLQFVQLHRIIKNGELRDCGQYRLAVVNDTNIAPFSWGRYIVINAADYAEGAEFIIAHECAHISRRHSLDMLAIQLICVLQWFNPAAWLLRTELKTVHEYQADRSVIAAGVNIRQYQMLLIKKAVGSRFQSLANSLNHSNLKKRITMMYKSQNRGARRLRALVMAPALAAAFVLAGTPAVTAAIGSIAGASLGQLSSERSARGQVKVTPAASSVNGRVAAISVSPAADQSADKGTKNSANTGKQTLPEFPGGEQALFKYLSYAVEYPASAMAEGREGTAIVQFVVNADGSIVDVHVTKSIGADLDAEAERVVNSMPRWNPGTVDGKPVAVSYALPITFKLTKKDAAEKKGATKAAPTIEIDGQIYNGDLNSINPATIESMTVVKNRAEYPNGLIVITLKK